MNNGVNLFKPNAILIFINQNAFRRDKYLSSKWVERWWAWLVGRTSSNEFSSHRFCFHAMLKWKKREFSFSSWIITTKLNALYRGKYTQKMLALRENSKIISHLKQKNAISLCGLNVQNKLCGWVVLSMMDWMKSSVAGRQLLVAIWIRHGWIICHANPCKGELSAFVVSFASTAP